VASFAWLATLGKIITMDILRKRNIIVVDGCCKKNEQSVDHLLLIVRLLVPYGTPILVFLG
jgi:hypothetical protein